MLPGRLFAVDPFRFDPSYLDHSRSALILLVLAEIAAALALAYPGRHQLFVAASAILLLTTAIVGANEWRDFRDLADRHIFISVEIHSGLKVMTFASLAGAVLAAAEPMLNLPHRQRTRGSATRLSQKPG